TATPVTPLSVSTGTKHSTASETPTTSVATQGEGTREFLESVPFAGGYGVEIGLLLDAEERYGLDGLAQVNLGVRKHRNRSLLQLGVMSRQILGTALARCGMPSAEAARFTQFVQVSGEWVPDVTEVPVADRPPMREVLAARQP
ncbi:hypothetical protein ABT279_27310, partial [Amycolatopsis sp. NPDC000673]